MRARFPLQALILSLSLSGLWGSSAHGGVVGIRPTGGVQVLRSEGAWLLRASLINPGTDTAHDISVQRPGGARESLYPRIPGGKAFVFETRVSAREAGVDRPGIYHLPFLFWFKDDREYAFSVPYVVETEWALSPAGQPRLERARWAGAGVAQARLEVFYEGTAEAVVHNQSAATLEVEPLLVSAREIHLRLVSPGRLKLAPGERRGIPIAVTNLSALSGATYVSYVIFRTLSEERHESQVEEIAVRVLPAPHTGHLLGLFGIFGVLFTLVPFLNSSAKRRKHT